MYRLEVIMNETYYVHAKGMEEKESKREWSKEKNRGSKRKYKIQCSTGLTSIPTYYMYDATKLHLPKHIKKTQDLCTKRYPSPLGELRYAPVTALWGDKQK